MEPRRPLGVRVAAGSAAAGLALGLPVCIVLLAVVGDNWRPLVGVFMIVCIAVPLLAWFLTKRKERRVAHPEPGEGPHQPS